MRRRPSRRSANRAPIIIPADGRGAQAPRATASTHPDRPCERRIVVPAPLQSLDSAARDSAGEVRHDHHDRLAPCRRAPDRAGGGDRRPDEMPPGIPSWRARARAVQAPPAGHRRDFVDDRPIENVGDPAPSLGSCAGWAVRRQTGLSVGSTATTRSDGLRGLSTWPTPVIVPRCRRRPRRRRSSRRCRSRFPRPWCGGGWPGWRGS